MSGDMQRGTMEEELVRNVSRGGRHAVQPAPWWSDGAARGHGGGAEKRKDWDDITCYGCRRRGHPVHLCPEAAQERREEQWHGDQVERAHGEALEEDLHPEMQGCV